MTTVPQAPSLGERAYPSSFERAAYSAIVQSVPHAVLLVDARQHIVLVNRAAAILFGRTPARLRGVPVCELLPADTLNGLWRDFGPHRLRVIETSLISLAHQPSIRTIKITAVPLVNSKASRFMLLMVEDLSDRAMLEQQLVDSEKQAAMGQLAAGLLHEVANPLTSLGSNLLFVRDTLAAHEDPTVAQALDASLEQLEQMRALLGTLSSFPGRTAPRYEIADMHELIRHCVAFIARDAEHRRISTRVCLAPVRATVEMDVRLIKQVLLNLMKNAMEAMPHGGHLAIFTWQAASEGQPGSLVIDVADTGTGIAEADLRRVFRPLFTTKRRGAGLGLSFCRQTVEEHGGAIRITSAGKDQGTTVCISLPVRQPLTQDE